MDKVKYGWYLTNTFPQTVVHLGVAKRNQTDRVTVSVDCGKSRTTSEVQQETSIVFLQQHCCRQPEVCEVLLKLLIIYLLFRCLPDEKLEI